MPRQKKYKTAKAFEKACLKYFASITRRIPVTVPGKGGLPQKVKNADGEYAERIEFLSPPTITGLCLYLGIYRETWREYADFETNPDYAEVCAYVKMVIENWLEEQLCTRKKGVQGIIFNLQNNYGWKEKKEIELGPETRKATKSLTMSEKFELLCEIKAMTTEDFSESAGDLYVEVQDES